MCCQPKWIYLNIPCYVKHNYNINFREYTTVVGLFVLVSLRFIVSIFNKYTAYRLEIGGEPIGLVGTKLVNSFNGYFL